MIDSLGFGFGLTGGESALQAVQDLEAELAAPRFFGETDWHKGWKMAFPDQWQERTFLNKELGYSHRADVFTSCGTAIEFQNSPITLQELQSREAFYTRLVWVVNGNKFKGFKILKALPDINDPRICGLDFSLTSNLTMIDGTGCRPMTFAHPRLRSIPMSSCYYSFRWSNPHKVWYQAIRPIVIDFGGYFLYRLCQREQPSGAYPYLLMIPRKSFVDGFSL